MDAYRLSVVVGSLRRDPINRKLASALALLALTDFAFHHVRIDDLPAYKQDDDA